MNIVGKRFSPSEFKEYVASLDLPNAPWTGSFVVLHNTGVPTMAQRPNGFDSQQMQNLATFYDGKGWHAGPHLFIDDNGIWAFSPLTAPGVHSPSWNDVAYGVEMLGDFTAEEFGGSVRGQAIRANAVAAIGIICKSVGIDSGTLHLHREDPQTTHRDCPGKNVDKADMIQRIHDYIAAM